MASLANAYINIIPSMEGVGSEITSTMTSEGASAGDAGGASAGESFASKIKSVIAAAGIGVAVKKVFDSIDSVAQKGDEIEKTSQKWHVTAEEYQALAFAGEHCAISTGTFQKAVKTLQGTGYKGTLTDFLDSLMDIDDVSKRNAKAHEILGDRVANEMAAYINGDKSITDYKNDLEDLGGMMSNESVEASATYEDSLTDMKTAMDGVKTQMMDDFLPSCSTVMTGVAEVVSGDSGGFAKIIDGVGSFIGKIAEKAVELVESLIKGITEQLPNLVQQGGTMLMSLVDGIMEQLPEWLNTAGTLLNNLLDAILDALPQLLDMGMNILLNIVNGIVNNLPQIVTSAIEIVSKILSTITSHLPQILSKGMELIGKLVSGLIKAIPKIVAAMPQIIKSITDKITSTDWLQIGKDIINGMIKGIKSMVNSLGSAVKDVTDSAVKGIKKFLGIKSPSRLFKNQIGKYITLGLAEGILSEVDSVNNAMDILGNATTQGFDASVNYQSSNSVDMAEVSYMLRQLVNKGQNIYLDTGELVGGIANKMDTQLNTLQLKGARGL